MAKGSRYHRVAARQRGTSGVAKTRAEATSCWSFIWPLVAQWRIGHVFANNLPQLAEGVPPLVAVAVLLFTGPFFLSSDFIARTLSDKTKFSGRARLGFLVPFDI